MNSVNGAFSFCMLRELIWRLKMDVIKKIPIKCSLSIEVGLTDYKNKEKEV